jgi:hypothetical protein
VRMCLSVVLASTWVAVRWQAMVSGSGCDALLWSLPWATLVVTIFLNLNSNRIESI